VTGASRRSIGFLTLGTREKSQEFVQPGAKIHSKICYGAFFICSPNLRSINANGIIVTVFFM